ncbi:MAG: CPBP family intramembrane metalloprotease [Clostridia bacterium]|nr:CPBP family intramembrane metalloprotease [Clostridia bacterium]
MEEFEEGGMREVSPNLNSINGGLTFSAAVIFYFAVQLIASIIIGAAHLDEKSDAYIYISYLCAPIAIVSCIAAVLKVRKIHPKLVFPVKCNPKYYLIAVMLIFGLLFSLSWVDGAVVEFFKLFGYKPREASSYFPNLSGGRIVPAFIVVAVMPALIEEALFRGVILNCCENSVGSIRTVFIVGFCFSLFHGSPEQTVYQFIAGCAFAFIAIRSGSILPSVLMHFINNALIIIFKACGMFDTNGNLIMPQTVNIVLIVLGALSLIGGLVWLILDKKPVKKCVKGGVKCFFIYASVGIAALALNWILLLFGVG